MDCVYLSPEEYIEENKDKIFLWDDMFISYTVSAVNVPDLSQKLKFPYAKLYKSLSEYLYDTTAWHHRHAAWVERNQDILDYRSLRRQCYFNRRNYTWAYVQMYNKLRDLGMGGSGQALGHLVASFVSLPDFERV